MHQSIASLLAELALTCEIVVLLRGRLLTWPVLPLPYFNRIIITSCPSFYRKIISIACAESIYVVFSRLSAHTLLDKIYVFKCKLKRIIIDFELSDRILRRIYQYLRHSPKKQVLTYLAASLETPLARALMWWYRRRVIVELEPLEVCTYSSTDKAPGLLMYLPNKDTLKVLRVSANDLRKTSQSTMIISKVQDIEHSPCPACTIFYTYDTYFRNVYQIVREGLLEKSRELVQFRIKRTHVLKKTTKIDELSLLITGLRKYSKGLRTIVSSLKRCFGAGGGI